MCQVPATVQGECACEAFHQSIATRLGDSLLSVGSTKDARRGLDHQLCKSAPSVWEEEVWRAESPVGLEEKKEEKKVGSAGDGGGEDSDTLRCRYQFPPNYLNQHSVADSSWGYACDPHF